ncbi:hypothetical protein P8452_43048 [Trifolium repens]|nr:hypothetical protein P8452_43048 [Trifolium repens]
MQVTRLTVTIEGTCIVTNKIASTLSACDSLSRISLKLSQQHILSSTPQVLRHQKGHKYCLLVQLSSKVGWNNYETTRMLLME